MTNTLSPRLLPMPSACFRVFGIKRTLEQYNERISEIVANGISHEGLAELTLITDLIQRLNQELRELRMELETAND